MKDRNTYKILTLFSFLIPLNRFYLGTLKGVVLRSLSSNYFLLGWISDLFYMDKVFDEAMAKRGFINVNNRTNK